MSAEDFLRLKKQLIPVVTDFLQDLRRGDDPRGEAKAMFGTTGIVSRDLHLRIGIDEGTFTQAEWNDIVDTTYSKL